MTFPDNLLWHLRFMLDDALLAMVLLAMVLLDGVPTGVARFPMLCRCREVMR